MKKCIVFVGPSGSGKNTLALELEKLGYIKLVTSTTRKRRDNEVEDIDYHFVNEINPDDYVECIEYASNFYGLSKSEVEMKLKKYDKVYIIMNIDGCEVMKKFYPETISIGFYLKREKLIERLQLRKENEETIQKRLFQYEKEKEDYKRADYFIDANQSQGNMIEQLHEILKRNVV